MLAACAAGVLLTLALLAGTGVGPERWLFVLLAWAVLVYMPLRILIESSQPLGEGARRALVARLRARPERYERPAYRALTIRELASRTPPPARILRPRDRRVAVEAAVAVVGRAMAGPDPPARLRAALQTVLAATADQAAHLGDAAAGPASDNIQARWDGARSLGALAALAATLAAVHADRWGAEPVLPEMQGRRLPDLLAAAHDYADEAALQVDALPWTEPPWGPGAAGTDIGAVLEAWRSLLAAGLPAPRAMAIFGEAVLP